jgi:chemosensory pili system protein ChpC
MAASGSKKTASRKAKKTATRKKRVRKAASKKKVTAKKAAAGQATEPRPQDTAPDEQARPTEPVNEASAGDVEDDTSSNEPEPDPTPDEATPAGTAGAPAVSVHCTLAAVDNDTLILPTSVIAEIVEFEPPRPIESAPAWMLGQVDWESWQVPVISYSALINGVTPEQVTDKSRTLIVKSLSDASRVPYIGVLVADLPRLSQVRDGDLRETGDEARALGVHSRVAFKDSAAIVPDLDRLAELVAHAAYGTLPSGSGPVADA